MLKKALLTIILLNGLLTIGYGQTTHTVTLSTYYPPPIAAFDKIRLVPTPTKAANCSIGTIYMEEVKKTLFFCKDNGTGGEWTPLSGGIWTLGEATDNLYLTDNLAPIDRDLNGTWDLHETHLSVGQAFGPYIPVFRLTLQGDSGANDGGIIASGPRVEFNANDPPTAVTIPAGTWSTLSTAGAGTRFFWYPKKAALRAGTITIVFADPDNTGDNWDETQVGDLSVAFGHNTRAAWLGSMIHGGYNNQTSRLNSTNANFSAILGGHDNKVRAQFAVVGGGQNNQVLAARSIVGGGDTNTSTTASDPQPTDDPLRYGIGIGGGQRNNCNLNHGTILGGQLNRIYTLQSATNDLGCSFIGGGLGNLISRAQPTSTSPEYNTIFGGTGNIIQDVAVLNLPAPENSTIGGGLGNLIQPEQAQGANWLATNSIILGGFQNIIYGGSNSASGATTGNAIGGGFQNIVHGESNIICGGVGNQILPPSIPGDAAYLNAIVGGSGNIVQRTSNFIGGGFQNKAISGTWSTVVGGWGNQIINTNQNCFIGGGYFNTMSGGTTSYAAIPIGLSIEMQADTGTNSLVAGKHIKLVKNGSQAANRTFVWGFGTPASPQQIYRDNAFLLFDNDADNPHPGGAIWVGVGTAAPQHALHIRANTGKNGLKIDNGKLVLVNVVMATGGATQLDWDASQTVSQDLAERFETSEAVTTGDLLVMDTGAKMKLKKSFAPYDRTVVGVVSAAPAILFEGSQMIIAPKPFEFTKGTTPPVALKGRVMVKVSRENGSIEIGDVLTSSSTPGHAMKSTDPQKEMGTIVGKALAPFNGGPNGETTGLIPVFIALH